MISHGCCLWFPVLYSRILLCGLDPIWFASADAKLPSLPLPPYYPMATTRLFSTS